MQLPILRALALVAVGNAALAGRDVSAFYPGDTLFRFTASLGFMTPREGGALRRVADGPVDWFKKLQSRACRGLRLHNAPMNKSQKLGHIDEHLLVGMVGGGPRWLIETVYPERSELWEGFDRIGDQKAADGKIWQSAYILLGEAEPTGRADAESAGAERELSNALALAEEVARALPGAPFAETFAGARATLRGQDLPFPLSFLDYTFLAPDERRLLNATGKAWVFGAMGSWNDLAPSGELKERYETSSKALFAALQRSVLVVANSTYRG